MCPDRRLLAAWRLRVNSIWPGIIVHVAIDTLGGYGGSSAWILTGKLRRLGPEKARDLSCLVVVNAKGFPMICGYLHTNGPRILDAQGHAVLLAGVNWYGFDCSDMVAGGLHLRTVSTLCEHVASLGFNCLRLPYCVQSILDGAPISNGLDRMPELLGRTPLEVLDVVVDAAHRAGLKVILASQRSDAGWSAQENGLWYTHAYPEESWIAAWGILVRRYAADATVVGCDLRNEPGAPAMDATAWPQNRGALWGYGDISSSTPRDWASAAERAGNAILTINSELLIFVEGVRFDPAGPILNGQTALYWPGGNLTGVRASASTSRQGGRPIALDVPNRLVYSVHDYGPDMYRDLAWCQLDGTARTRDACRLVWDQTWGFLVREGIAPVLLGEFGTPNGYNPSISSRRGRPDDYIEPNDWNAQGAWFTYLVDYIHDLGIHWTYWCLNGSQSRAPGRDPRQPDWYGILTPDWRDTASESMMRKLRSIQPR